MSIGREDATRILRFCLAGVGWGSALHEEDQCVVKVALSGVQGMEVQRFEGNTFEAALRQAAAAGVVKAVSLEKQISFMARSLPARPAALTEDGPASRLGDRAEAQALFPRMTVAISALVHETQRERGTSSLYLSSGGRRFADQLHGQWVSTDARRAELMLFRRQNAALLPPPLTSRLEQAEDMLSGLCCGRPRIKALQVMPGEIIDSYSNANGQLLSVIDALAQTGVDTAVRLTALAWMALLYAKEKTGIERAQLASAFTWDRYAEGQHATVSALIAASDSYLHIFAAAAPRTASELLRKQLDSDVASAVTEMEKVALLKRDGGFGIDPTSWYASISLKMDLLGDVESAVRASLP
ncbi:MAG: nitrate- and nitrite sensing domain-containing protein [Myxococcales bacterium]